jgi:hypothetical protein
MDPEKELKRVFSQTFNIPEEKISAETARLKLQEWDHGDRNGFRHLFPDGRGYGPGFFPKNPEKD